MKEKIQVSEEDLNEIGGGRGVIKTVRLAEDELEIALTVQPVYECGKTEPGGNQDIFTK